MQHAPFMTFVIWETGELLSMAQTAEEAQAYLDRDLSLAIKAGSTDILTYISAQ